MTYFLVCILVAIVAFNLCMLKYDKGFSRRRNRFILPGQLFIYDRFLRSSLVIKSTVKKNRELIGEGQSDEDIRLEYAYRLTLANMVLVVVCLLGLVVGTQRKDDNVISKPEYYEGAIQVDIDVEADNSNNAMDDEKGIIKDSMTVMIEPTRMSKDSFEKLSKEVLEYIYQELPGENKSLDEVMCPLNLVDDYPDNEEVTIVWITDEEGYINSKGEIEEPPKEDVIVELLAIVGCQGYEATYPINVCIAKRDLSNMELIKSFIRIAIEEQNKDSQLKTVELPTEIAGVNLSYPQKQDVSKMVLLLLVGIMSGLVLVFGKDYEMKKKAEKLKENAWKEYSHIVSKLVLLMKGGVSVMNAWKKVAMDGCTLGVSQCYVYEMMRACVREIDNKKETYECLKSFAHKTGCESYLRLVTYINQNIHKGTDEILNILEMEMYKASQEKKNAVIKLGEKAGTKMMFPMMLLLLIVLVLAIIPALLMM